MIRKRHNRHVFLITGAGGFTGGRLARLLRIHFPKHEMIINMRSKTKKPVFPAEIFASKVIYGDLTDLKTWQRFPKNITHVFHLASSVPHLPENKNDPALIFQNLKPLLHLIEQSKKWPLRQVIFSSSVSVYEWGPKTLRENSRKTLKDFYSAAKLSGEILLENHLSPRVRVVSLRYSSIYGRGHYPKTVLPIMVERVRRKQPIEIWGKGLRTQDFIHVEDAALSNLLAYLKQARGAYNIGCGRPVTMARLAREISRVFSSGKAKIKYQKNKSEGPSVRLDISKAKRDLGFRPKPLKTGLQLLKKELNFFWR